MDDLTKALHNTWRWLFSLGATTLALGIFAIIVPHIATLDFEVTIGVVFVLIGVVHALHSFWAQEWGGFLFEIFGGVLYLLIGLTLLANPGAGVLMLAVLLAILLMMQGVIQLALSFELRPVSSWRWMFTSGIVAMLFGVLMWAPWPSTGGFWLMGLFIGISLLFTGWSMVILALSTRYPVEHESIRAAPELAS